MSILKYKYKAHKLINYAFYIIVFIVGFLLGFGAKKIDFNNLLSEFLMIENVSALSEFKGYKETKEFKYLANNENWYDSNFIYDMFEEVNTVYETNFDLNEYKYVFVYRSIYNGYPREFYRYIFSKSPISIISDQGGPAVYLYAYNDYIDIRFDYTHTLNNYDSVSLAHYYNITGQTTLHTSAAEQWSNEYVAGSTENTYLEELTKVIDLNQFNLEFNENLFKDNPDFKQVCVNSSTRFAITSNNITYNDDTELKFYNGIDFIWFSYVPDGLSTYLYSELVEDKVVILTEDGPLFNGINPGNWYYLDEKSEIDKFFNTNSSNGDIYPGSTLQREGYINKYSYFGWYFHPFVVHLDNTSDGGNYFSVFHFKDKLNFYSILENGLDYYEELENARNDNICFYIKNEYDIVILEKDVFGDDIGETIILGGDKLNINTSYNYSNLDSKGLFSKINLFINKIKDTIVFINNYIYELYTSMPYIVQLFIISIFGLIVVRILIGMVTR